jgi:hypothetical protein
LPEGRREAMVERGAAIAFFVRNRARLEGENVIYLSK